MIQKIIENPETLVSAIIFASIFFAGPRVRLVLETKKGYRRIISLSSGIAIAYVFMAFLPELSEASALFVEETHHASRVCIGWGHYDHNDGGAAGGKGRALPVLLPGRWFFTRDF